MHLQIRQRHQRREQRPQITQRLQIPLQPAEFIPHLRFQQRRQPSRRRRLCFLRGASQPQGHASRLDHQRRPRLDRHARLLAHVHPRRQIPKGPRRLRRLLPLRPRAPPHLGFRLRHGHRRLTTALLQRRLNLAQLPAGAQLDADVVQHPHAHAKMIRRRFVFPNLRLHPEAKPLAQLRRQRLGQRLAPVRQPVPRHHPTRELFRIFTQGHKRPAQFLGQRPQVMLHLRLEVPGHRPIERRRRERRRVPHIHIERHAVVGLPRLVSIGQRQRRIRQRHRLGKRHRIVHQGFRITQVLRLQHQEFRLRTFALAHQIDQLGHRADPRRGVVRRRPFFRQPRGVEPVDRLVQIQISRVARARERVFDFRPHRPIVNQTIQRKHHRVVHEGFADKNLRRVRRIDFAVAHRAALQFQSVKPRALFHHHAPRFFVPKRLAVRHAHHVRPQLQRPHGVEPRTGPRKNPRRLHHLRRHDPARRLRPFLRRGGGIRFSPFRLLAPKQHRSRKQRHAPVVGRLVAAVVLIQLRDVSEQTREHAAVNCPVARRAKGQRLLRVSFRVLPRAVVDRRHPKRVALPQGVEQLRVHVAPLPEARVAQKMIAAEPTQLCLGEPLELVVKRLPDVEQREKIRIRMRETPVRRVGLLLLVHRPVARILDAESRRDHQHFAQRPLGAPLENHAPHRGVHRQPRQLTPDLRERSRQLTRRLHLERPDLLQQQIPRANRLRRRRIDKRKPLDVTEAKRL